ncbi:MAG TPA: hypothetical protein VLB44_10175 [Kofleriaceae bacterium]|nr:hypothetical protein [Kofleriaceae bacterium]
MWFADLTAYTYSHSAPRPMLNIGWLDAVHPFPKGEVPAFLFKRLARWPRARQSCGIHDCELCPFVQPVGRVECPTTSSYELHVFGADGVCYAAPALIAHYVEVHDYRPPQPFIDAVMTTSFTATGESCTRCCGDLLQCSTGYVLCPGCGAMS